MKKNLLLIIVLFITPNITPMEKPFDNRYHIKNAENLIALLNYYRSTTHYPYCLSDSTLPPLRLERESAQKTNILVKYGDKKHIYAKSDPYRCYGQYQIEAFNIRSGQENETFPSQKYIIRHCVSTLDNRIIIASDYETIRIWGARNIGTPNLCLNIQPYSFNAGSPITSLAAENNILCSSNLNNHLQIWDIDLCNCIEKEITGKNIRNLMIRNNLVHIGCHDGMIITFDPRSGENIYDWHAHKQAISSLTPGKRNDYCLYSGSEDHSINIWDIRNLSTHINQLSLPPTTHKNPAITNMLEDKEARILFASDGDTVYEWDVSQIMPQLLSSLCLKSAIKNKCMVLDENAAETTIGKELHVSTKDGIKTIRCDYSFDELFDGMDTK